MVADVALSELFYELVMNRLNFDPLPTKVFMCKESGVVKKYEDQP